MADLINNSTGNFTTAATWSLVDSTSFLNSETNTTATTTAFVGSSTFVPGIITIDGIAVKVSSHTNPGTGTFSVRLFNTTLAAAVAGTTVTINVTDLPIVNTSVGNGWVFMKFAAPVLLLIANSYRVEVSSSINATVTLYRDATAGNWSRALRTTTNQAPGSADNLHIMGEYISAGSNNSFTVTMNNADAGATTFGLVEVSSKGTLSYGIAAATAYYLKLAGNLSVYTGGVYSQGSTGTRIPVGSSASLEFVCGANVQFGLEIRLGGTFNGGGALITNRAFLAADAAAAATSLTTDVSTGWLNGDVIALASTTRTKAESESKGLTANAVGTTLTITAITNAHSGTGATAGELINLTRNVKIFSNSTTNQTYVNILGTSVVNVDSVEFFNMGSATALKRGIDVGTTTGSLTLTNCAVHDFNVASSVGINCGSGAGNNFTISNNVLYNIANIGVNQVATSGTAYTHNNNITILTGSTGFNIADLTGVITNLTGISATGAGIAFADSSGAVGEVFGTLSGFIAHSNTTIGVSLATIFAVTNNPMATFSNITAYRNTTVGLNVSNTFSVIIDTVTAFGNGQANVGTGGTDIINVYFRNMTINAGTTLTSPIGLNIAGDTYGVFIDNSTYGVTTTHATADVVAASAVGVMPQVVLRDCLLNSTTPVSNSGTMTVGGFLGLARFQQIAGNHKTFKKYGTITSDTTIFNSGPVSSRLTPSSAVATEKLQSSITKFAVPNGSTATIKLFLRKSVVGDGAAYNGNQPRLILRLDTAVGVTSDTVLATADNTYNGVFKALTATTIAITDNAAYQVYIDCDGTTGFVNVDDFSVTYS